MRRIEGYVIVSADGMIADAKGEMPPSIRNDADQRFFQDALDHAAVVVHGRHSHEGGPRAARRKRLILTRQVAALAPDSAHPHALLWNPVGATLEQALGSARRSATAPSPSSAALKCSACFCRSTTHFTCRSAANAKIPGGLPYSAKSVRMPRRKTYSRVMASNLGRAATSIPPSAFRL